MKVCALRGDMKENGKAPNQTISHHRRYQLPSPPPPCRQGEREELAARSSHDHHVTWAMNWHHIQCYWQMRVGSDWC